MKLTSMTDFVLKESCNKDRNSIDNLNTIFRYALFLKQPLELWMFVPCAVDGEVLEKPERFDFFLKYKYQSYDIRTGYKLDEYLKAKERVLFEGFEIDGGIVWHKAGLDNTLFIFGLCEDKYKTIEDLVSSRFPNLKLTPTAIKQIGL